MSNSTALPIDNNNHDNQSSHEHHDGCCAHEHNHSHEHHEGCCSHEHNHSHEHAHEHNHEHHDECCGHNHEHSHEHEHKHDHHGECCSHEHNHSHEHTHEHNHDHHDSGCCGHEHNHSHEHQHEHHHEATISNGYQQRIYTVDNLDCANCAAKVEAKLNEIPEVQQASLSFFTKQLKITAKDPDALLEKIREVADKTEPGVTIMPREVNTTGLIEKIYIVDNLDCANCAAEVEEVLNKIPEVEQATLTFFTKQLKIVAKNPDALLEKIREVADKTEPGVTIMPRETAGNSDVPAGYTQKIYSIENLDCANCAAEVEEALNKIPEVYQATVTFATKQLKVVAKDPDALLETMRQVADKTEPGTTIVPRKDIKELTKTESKGLFSKENMPLIEIISGAILFIIGEFTSIVPEQYVLYLYIIAYIILGGKIVKIAVTNLFRGNVFDENFLMSIATLGAFAIAEYPEAVGVMLFYRIGEYFEHRATEKSRTQIMEAVDLRPETVNLVNADGEVTVVPAEQAKIGDILLVRAGDRIPVDGIVIEGESRVDTSPVTGEPVPVKIDVDSEITSGCLNISGVIKMRVEKPLSESMVTRILASVENAASTKPKIDRFITRFARIYTPIVVAVAAITAIVPSLITGNWEQWIYTALTFLVISCPCALVLSVPLAFFSGIGAGSRKGILFKGGVSLEAIKNVKAIIMDKTGTLTEGSFTVKSINPTADYTTDELLKICASCETYSTHPIAVSIVNAAKDKDITLINLTHSDEIAGQGLVCTLEDKNVLCGNKRLMNAYHIELPEDTVAHADTEIYIAVNNKYAGSIIIGDTIKEDAKSTVQKLKGLGLITAMLTGDNENSANAVAKAVGIDEVHAKLLPEGKLDKLVGIRQKHGNVLFVGDGINDAPILAGADVGAAMGSGADAAIEAADVVFMNSKVDAILQAIHISRNTISIAWQNVVFALVVKVAIMLLGLAGFASMWAAVFADTGVSIICILNSIRILYKNY